MKSLKRIIVLVITVLSLTIVFCYGQNIAEQAEQSWKKGVEYAVQGKFKDAKEENAIEINPKYADAYINLGIAYEANGDMKKACADWKKACELGNCSYWVIINKLRCLFSF